MNIAVRQVKTIEECRAIERLMRDIWESDNIDVVPDHLLLTIAKEGGVVQLVLDEVEQPIGFSLGFLSQTEDNRLKLASHQIGVLPEFQGRGIGYQIKLAQREAALARNLDLITWTFDPLQGRNARLNLRKLGTVCNTYIRELYGQMRSELNQGLPSDRFRVDWWIRSVHVAQRLAGQGSDLSLPALDCPTLNPTTRLDNGLIAPSEHFELSSEPYYLVEIPADIQTIKSEAPELAWQWHRQVRTIFESAFESGYTAIDLLRHDGRNFYLLQQNWQPL